MPWTKVKMKKQRKWHLNKWSIKISKQKKLRRRGLWKLLRGTKVSSSTTSMQTLKSFLGWKKLKRLSRPKSSRLSLIHLLLINWGRVLSLISKWMETPGYLSVTHWINTTSLVKALRESVSSIFLNLYRLYQELKLLFSRVSLNWLVCICRKTGLQCLL